MVIIHMTDDAWRNSRDRVRLGLCQLLCRDLHRAGYRAVSVLSVSKAAMNILLNMATGETAEMSTNIRNLKAAGSA